MKTGLSPRQRQALLAAFISAGTAITIPAQADGRGRGGPGWNRPPAPAPRVWTSPHRHGGFNGWWIVGAPWLFYPPYYPQPPVVVREEAPVSLPALPPAPQQWYYCNSAATYYPYTQTCPEGWRSVPAQPPGPAQAAPAQSQTWYYCESAKGYYPYVQRCPEQWRPIAAVQPPQPADGGTPEPTPQPLPEGTSRP